MASKGLIVLSLLLAGAFLVTTAEQTQAKKEETKADVQGYGGGGGGYHGGGGGYHGGGGGGYHGGGGGGSHGGGGGGGHGCHRQCCGHGGCHCCSPDEVPTEVRN